MTHEHHALGLVGDIHIALAVLIMAAYLMIPFTALRKLPLPRVARISGSLFFATCAITHLGIAVGFHSSAWMVLNDAVQAASAIVFILVLNHLVGYVLRRRRTTEPVIEQP